jgi:hypothetical protein
MRRVSDTGPIAIYERALRAGVRKPPGKEPAVGGVGVAVYGDLTAGRPLRAMCWSAEQSVADRLQRTQRRHCGFRGGDLGVTSGIARVFSVDAAPELRHRKQCPPAGGRCEEVSTVVMASRP